MGIEIEVKFRISDPAIMRETLLAAGAEATGTVLEENTYFDTSDASLRRSDCGLRIRTAKPSDGGVKWSVLTYKGPRREGELKIRAEEEIIINSPDTAHAILSALGYCPT
ncbi:MAG: class IV adenylate cyclase, partial [Phycisphaerae bacterium]|nr:class IV adenylate cyclase [Phycisphaerae bacterium]